MTHAQLLIAIRDDDERVGRCHAATEIGEEVERRRVGPLGIFDDQQDRAAAGRESREDGAEEEVTRGVVAEESLQRRVGVGHVENRAELPGGGQVIALAKQHVSVRTHLVAETPHQRRLPGASLTTQQEQGTASLVSFAQQPMQLAQDRIAFQQVHQPFIRFIFNSRVKCGRNSRSMP